MAAPSWYPLMSALWCHPGILSHGQATALIRKANRWHFFSTSTTRLDRPQNEKATRVVETLDPSRMKELGQQVFDISGYMQPAFLFSPSAVARRRACIEYGYETERSATRPFPPGSIGSLYYHQPAPPLPDIAGELRFRLMPHVEAFVDGEDLRRPDGSPWQVYLCNLAKSEKWRPARLKLLEDSLVDPGVFDDLRELEITIRGTPRYLYDLGQPFELDMSFGSICKTLIKRSMAFRWRWDVLSDLYRDPSQRSPPYTGRIRVCLELSKDLPDSGVALVLRVLEVLTPIKCLQPDLDFIKRPVPGELLSRVRKRSVPEGIQLSDGAYRPFFYDLRKRKNGENIAKFLGISLS